MAAELKTTADKLYAFAVYLATPLAERVGDFQKDSAIRIEPPIASAKRFVEVLPDAEATDQDRIHTYRTIEYIFRSFQTVSADKASSLALTFSQDRALHTFVALFDPNAYVQQGSNLDSAAQDFLAAFAELKANIGKSFRAPRVATAPSGADTFAAIVEAYRDLFIACKDYAFTERSKALSAQIAAREKELADRERELAERELTAKEQNEKLKQQNLMLTEKLKEQAVAEPAGASGRRPAGKTLPNYPRAEVARAIPVETPTESQPVAKPAVQFLNFMPKGGKLAPTRVSPGGPFSSERAPVVPISAAKTTTKPVRVETTGKSRVSKKEKERNALKAAKVKAKINDLRAEDILAREPLEITELGFSGSATKKLLTFHELYLKEKSLINKLKKELKRYEDAKLDAPGKLQRKKAEAVTRALAIHKQVTSVLSSAKLDDLSPMEKLQERARANKERTLRAMESSESSDSSDDDSDSDSSEQPSVDSMVSDDEPPTRRDIAAKRSREPIPVPPAHGNKKRKREIEEEDQVEEKRPKKQPKKQAGSVSFAKKKKTPRITTNEALGSAVKLNIISPDTEFRMFSSCYKAGPSQKQYESDFATKTANHTKWRYTFVMDRVFREAAANLDKPVDLDGIPDAAVLVGQAAGRSVCDSTAPVFTVRVSEEAAVKNNVGADRAYFSGYVDQASSTVVDVDLPARLNELFPVGDFVERFCNASLDPAFLAQYKSYSEEHPGYYPVSQAILDCIPVYQAFRGVYAPSGPGGKVTKGKLEFNLKQMTSVVFPTKDIVDEKCVTVNSAVGSAFIRFAVFGVLNGRGFAGTLNNGFVDSLTIHLDRVCQGMVEGIPQLARILQRVLGMPATYFVLPGLESILKAHRSSGSAFPADKVAAAATVDDLRDVVNLFEEFKTLAQTFVTEHGQLYEDEFVAYAAPYIQQFVASHNRLAAAIRGSSELPSPLKTKTKTINSEEDGSLDSILDQEIDQVSNSNALRSTQTNEKHFVPPTMRLTPAIRLADQSAPLSPQVHDLLQAFRQHVAYITPNADSLDHHPALNTNQVGFDLQAYTYGADPQVSQEPVASSATSAPVDQVAMDVDPIASEKAQFTDTAASSAQPAPSFGDIDPDSSEAAFNAFAFGGSSPGQTFSEDVSGHIPSLSAEQGTLSSLD